MHSTGRLLRREATLAITYSIDPNSRTLSIISIDEVNDAQVVVFFENLLADPRFTPGLNLLMDMTLQSGVPGSQLIRDTARRIEGKEFSFSRIAIVANRDALFGVARMFEVYAEKATTAVRTFRSRDEALEWIAVGHGSG